jgi:hypothetical protein
MEQQNLKRILVLKERIMQLQSKFMNLDPLQMENFVKINSVKVESIEKYQSYPEDYKIFLEEIGTVYVAYADAFMLEVCLPRNLEDCWWISNEEITGNENFRIIIHTDNDDIEYMIYDITKTPFERYCTDESDLKFNFLDIVEKKIEDCFTY